MGGRVELTSLNGSVVAAYDSLTAIVVKQGDEVNFGQKIGELGQSMVPDFCASPHLHLEILVDGEVKDPAVYLKLS